MGVTAIRRLKQLEGENGGLKKIVADLTFDKPCCRMFCAESGEALRSA
jgi:hypothetical protein